MFPEVLTVILNTEADSGLEPIVPMDGTDCKRVGYTIVMSVNLGNSSHFDIHHVSQGFTVWSEENPSMGSNWYFVMPNVHGKRPVLRFGSAMGWQAAGMAEQCMHHCMSTSMPDGPDGKRVGRNRHAFQYNLFGTFISAKQKILAAGKALNQCPC